MYGKASLPVKKPIFFFSFYFFAGNFFIGLLFLTLKGGKLHASSLPNFASELALPLSVQAALECGAGAGARGGVRAAAVKVQWGLRWEIEMLVFVGKFSE